MKTLLIAAVGVSIGLAPAAVAQSFGMHRNMTGFGRSAATTQPTESAAQRAWAVPQPPPPRHATMPGFARSPGSMANIDGGEGFKPYRPFEGSSVYGPKRPAAPKHRATD